MWFASQVYWIIRVLQSLSPGLGDECWVSLLSGRSACGDKLEQIEHDLVSQGHYLEEDG